MSTEADMERTAARAVPTADWRIVVNEDVLIYVVHDHAQYEKDEAVRREKWEGWFIGCWVNHNKGGWMWNGMLGRVTHVAPLPDRPAIIATDREVQS